MTTVIEEINEAYQQLRDMQPPEPNMQKWEGDEVVQIVTDAAARCKAAAEKLSIECPPITWTPCTAHQTDVLLTSIDKLPCVKPLIDSAKSR
jgi:hypothetical protein